MNEGFEIYYSEATMVKLCRWSSNLKSFALGWLVSGVILLPADIDHGFFKIWVPIMALFVIAYFIVDQWAFNYKFKWLRQDIKRVTQEKLNEYHEEPPKGTRGKTSAKGKI